MGQNCLVWLELNCQREKHSATHRQQRGSLGFRTQGPRGVTDARSCSKEANTSETLFFTFFLIIFAVVANLPGINSLVFGGHDCQWMNQEPLA